VDEILAAEKAAESNPFKLALATGRRVISR
jgi:hypothetical protein